MNDLYGPRDDEPGALAGVSVVDLTIARAGPTCVRQLADMGAVLTYSDPHIPELPAMRHYRLPPMHSQGLTAEFLTSQDCILIATDHSSCDYDFIVRHAPLVVDTRNATKNVVEGREKIRKA